MGKVYKVYDKRDNADKYTAKEDDTLEAIAAKYPQQVADWKEVALYNWGTEVPREVNRALTEIIGVKKLDEANPGKTVLKPYQGAKTEVLVPKLWKKAGYAQTQRHPIKVKRLPRPQNAIAITKLDKWFIPSSETCDISYQLEGLKETADRVAFEVYGSNYCKCTDWKKGHGAYTALPDTPVLKQADGNGADERSPHDIKVDGAAWKGQSNATDGILKVKTDNKPRHINVAFSPYNVHLLYYKQDADKNAYVGIEPFWPVWTDKEATPAATTTIEAAQLKFDWTNAAKADAGVLQVMDKNGQIVHMEELAEAKLAAGAQNVTWDKQYTGGAQTSEGTEEYCPTVSLAGTFDADGYVTGNMRANWNVANDAGLASGKLTITDCRGIVVFERDLEAGDLTKGAHTYDWNGAYKAGVTNSIVRTRAFQPDAAYTARIEITAGGTHPAVVVAPAFDANGNVTGNVAITWEVAAALGAGDLVVRDKHGTVVFRKALTNAERAVGSQKYDWNGDYTGGANNTARTNVAIRGDELYQARIQVVNNDARTYPIGTLTTPWKPSPPPAPLELRLDGSVNLQCNITDAGLKEPKLIIKDRTGRVVLSRDLGPDEVTVGNHVYSWGGHYTNMSTKNSGGNPYAISADAPYTAHVEGKITSKQQDDILGDGPYTCKVTTIVRERKAESLKITWEIEDTARLERGLLQVYDGKDKLVFQKPLVKADVTQAEHSFTWDGKYFGEVKNSKNGTEAIREDMPYRVQVQGHTDIDQDNGVAVAAMHTEVRLYVDPKTRAPKSIAYNPWDGPPSLALALGPYVPGDPPQKAAGTKWCQYKLAESGFHPGPVNGTKHDPYKIALKEFKRSVPKQHAVGADYERLTIDENEDNDTKNAIEHMEAKYAREPLGDLARVTANDDAPDLANDVLHDPAQDIVVWADDRQYYTEGSGKDENNHNYLSGAPARVAFGLANYRGKMDIADGKTDRDAESIPRPWIPLRVDLPILSKATGLYDTVTPAVADVNAKQAMQRAIGPLRVDWTFDELPYDLSTISVVGYDKRHTRTRQHLLWVLNQFKGTHTRKDTTRPATYTNCKETHGGIRPNALATYYEKAFGTGNLNLAPWEATAVAATESVATVVHDHLIASQVAKTNLFTDLIGVAGAYFHPSNIAGDGYRVRAEVQFKEHSDYQMLNLKVLDARYPVPPQAHSARLRVWRRSSIRGYTCWAAAATGHWPGLLNGFRNHYKAAHVYFVPEAGAAPQNFNITAAFNPATPAHVTRYRNIIWNNVAHTYPGTAQMSLRAADIWPWGTLDNLGISVRSPVGLTTRKQLYDQWFDPDIIDPTWRAFRASLLYALVKEAEKLGYLRGHLFVEFAASPAMEAHLYRCNKPAQHLYHYIVRAGGVAPGPHPCPAAGCGTTGGQLQNTGSCWAYNGGFPLPAVGVALGATWLFTTSDADTWAHEVGHHRHLEHAADGPGAKLNLHDSEDNTTQAWPGGTAANRTHWDRNCVMSYASCNYPGGKDYLCGRCLLRNRGWKVTALGLPPAGMREP